MLRPGGPGEQPHYQNVDWASIDQTPSLVAINTDAKKLYGVFAETQTQSPISMIVLRQCSTDSLVAGPNFDFEAQSGLPKLFTALSHIAVSGDGVVCAVANQQLEFPKPGMNQQSRNPTPKFLAYTCGGPSPPQWFEERGVLQTLHLSYDGARAFATSNVVSETTNVIEPEAYLWDCASGNCRTKYKPLPRTESQHTATAASVSWAANIAVVGYSSGSLGLISLEENMKSPEFGTLLFDPAKEHNLPAVTSVELSSNGSFAIFGAGANIYVCDVDDTSVPGPSPRLTSIGEFQSAVTGVSLSPDGATCVAVSTVLVATLGGDTAERVQHGARPKCMSTQMVLQQQSPAVLDAKLIVRYGKPSTAPTPPEEDNGGVSDGLGPMEIDDETGDDGPNWDEHETPDYEGNEPETEGTCGWLCVCGWRWVTLVSEAVYIHNTNLKILHQSRQFRRTQVRVASPPPTKLGSWTGLPLKIRLSRTLLGK